MIVKWLKKTGGGSAKATLDYMLGKDRNREGARLISSLAQAEQTVALADSLSFKHKYAVGVLSFEESADKISETDKHDIMKSFEKTIFAGLEREQYDICWIEHTDKQRLELNFIIPKVELCSGLSMNPYLHSKDMPLIDAWRNIINVEYGLSDPNDPAKLHTTTYKQRLPSDKKELLEAINGSIISAVQSGKIENRADIINHLQDLGLNITRTSKKSISVHHEDMGKLPMRLTGVFYEQNFSVSTINQDDIEERSRKYREAAQERLRSSQIEYQRLLERRRSYNQTRYQRKVIGSRIECSRRGIKQDAQSNMDATSSPRESDSTINTGQAAGGKNRYQSAGFESALSGRRGFESEKERSNRNRISASDIRSNSVDGSKDAEVVQGITSRANEDSLRGRYIDSKSFWSMYKQTREKSGYNAGNSGKSREASADEIIGNRCNSSQNQRNDDAQAVSARLHTNSNDIMASTHVSYNDNEQLQHEEQFRGITTTSSAHFKSASNNREFKQANRSSPVTTTDELSDGAEHCRRYQNHLKARRSNGDDKQDWDYAMAQRKISTDTKVTGHANTIFKTIRRAFSSVQVSARAAANRILTNIRNRINETIEAQSIFDDANQQIADIEQDIERRKQQINRDNNQTENRNFEIKQSDQRATKQNQAGDATESTVETRDKRVERGSEHSATDERSATETSRFIDNTKQFIDRTADYIAEREQESREANNYIEQLTQAIQERIQALESAPTKPIKQEKSRENDDFDFSM